jgi:hypothetical protein
MRTKGSAGTWFRRSTAVALALSAISVALDWTAKPETGLTRTLYASLDFQGEPVDRDLATDISLSYLDGQPDVPRRFSVEWDGIWYVQREGTFDISADVDDVVEVRLDGAVVLRKDLASRVNMMFEQVELAEGPHALNVRYEQHRGGYFLTVFAAASGSDLAPLSRQPLFPKTPTAADVTMNHRLEVFRRAVLVAWLFPLTAFIGLAGPPLVRRGLWLLDQVPFPAREL